METHRNEYDLMKKMIQMSRGNQNNNKSRLNEDTNIRTLTNDELSDEQNRFRQAIPGNAVEFGPFNIYENNIEWSGSFPTDRMTFIMSTTRGCAITCDTAPLTDESVQKIQKLKAYCDQWTQYWANES